MITEKQYLEAQKIVDAWNSQLNQSRVMPRYFVDIRGGSRTDPEVVVATFTKKFGFPVRLFWNRRLEAVNSSCAKAGTQLSFEQITNRGGRVIYRVRRGKRNFYTSDSEIKE